MTTSPADRAVTTTGTASERRARLRKQDADRLAAALKLAQQAMESAGHTWGLWADDVRQDVETRLGRSYEPDDPVILGDPEYAAALDVGGDLERIREAIAAAQERLSQVHPPAAKEAGDA